MDARMRRAALLLTLLVSSPAFAYVNCETIADDVVRQDRLLTAEAQEFTARYDTNMLTADAGIAARHDYLGRLDALINTMRRDIDGMRWLIAHHCGPAKEEPNAIKSVHDMELMLTSLLVRRMDARALR
jgi:hypothetical protein